VPDEAITFRTNEALVLAEAIRSGAGLGFLPVMQARAMGGRGSCGIMAIWTGGRR